MNGFLITIIVPVGQRSMVLENSIKTSFVVLHLASNIASDPERDWEYAEVIIWLFLSFCWIGFTDYPLVKPPISCMETMALLVTELNKDDFRRIDAFQLWCWRRVLRVPWTARRSNQSILREINLEYSLEGQMLKLKLQYFDHLMWTANWLEKSLLLGKTEGRRRRGHQRMRWLDGITNAMDMNLGKLRDGKGQGGLVCCSQYCKESDMTRWLNNNNDIHTRTILVDYCSGGTILVPLERIFTMIVLFVI